MISDESYRRMDGNVVAFVKPSAQVDPYWPATFTPGDDHAVTWCRRMRVGQRLCHMWGAWEPRNKAAVELLKRRKYLPTAPSPTIIELWDPERDYEPLPRVRIPTKEETCRAMGLPYTPPPPPPVPRIEDGFEVIETEWGEIWNPIG